ncbi:MAG: DUF4157 domain-containing protein [Reyranellaceae bacterium]
MGISKGPYGQMQDRINSAVASAQAATAAQSKGAALPHADKLKASFGRRDLDGVKAHVGGNAAAASKAMGAAAYATGNSVELRGGPDLHTAAHEAAHVLQQRAGMRLGPNIEHSLEAIAKEIAHSATPPHQGRAVVTPPSQPAKPSEAVGAAYATIKNIANIEPAPANAAPGAAAAAPGKSASP